MNGIVTLTFIPEQEGKPPTIDYEVIEELAGHVESIRVASDPALGNAEPVRAVVVKSASPKYFVVGANLRALREIDKDSIRTWVERGHEVFNALEALPVPVIALVTGYALGGGLEIAMACDFILATEEARFGLPEAGLGFIPGWGGTGRITGRVGLPMAKELMFTGRILPASQAREIGLVNFVGSREELDAHLAKLLDDVRSNSSISIAMIKRIANRYGSVPAAQSSFDESVASSVCLASGDTQRRLAEFFAKREKKQA